MNAKIVIRLCVFAFVLLLVEARKKDLQSILLGYLLSQGGSQQHNSWDG
jgi:hypothetical protein